MLNRLAITPNPNVAFQMKGVVATPAACARASSSGTRPSVKRVGAFRQQCVAQAPRDHEYPRPTAAAVTKRTRALRWVSAREIPDQDTKP